MQRQLPTIARRLWPELETLAGRARVSGLGNVFGTLYPLPLAIAGLVWLTTVTDTDIVRSHWPALLVVLGILYVFERLDFFYAVEIEKGLDATSTGTPMPILAWAAALIYGPTVIWLALAVGWIETIRTNLGRSARDIRDAVSGAVREFVVDAPQLDDVTVMIVARKEAP